MRPLLWVGWVLVLAGCGDTGEDSARTPKYPDSEIPDDCREYTAEAFIRDYVYARCRIERACTESWDDMDQCVYNDDILFECDPQPVSEPFGCGRAECVEDIRYLRDNIDELGCEREGGLYPWSVDSCVGKDRVFEECTEAYE